MNVEAIKFDAIKVKTRGNTAAKVGLVVDKATQPGGGTVLVEADGGSFYNMQGVITEFGAWGLGFDFGLTSQVRTWLILMQK
jgi:hypothetical protein